MSVKEERQMQGLGREGNVTVPITTINMVIKNENKGNKSGESI
jgi:hypothetical protein